MFFRSALLTTAVTIGSLAIPASAEASSTNPPTFTQTFVFPSIGLPASDTVRISVVNIAQAAHNGTKASCTGSIAFTDSTGAPIGTPIAFTGLGTGQIAVGDLPHYNPDPNPHHELQGSVSLTITPSVFTPCSLLMTLETFDTNTGVTHAVLTTAAEQPSASPIFTRGKD